MGAQVNDAALEAMTYIIPIGITLYGVYVAYTGFKGVRPKQSSSVAAAVQMALGHVGVYVCVGQSICDGSTDCVWVGLYCM